MPTAPRYNFNRITHYIPPATPFADLEVEFVHPVPDDYFIHWLFRYRCMECHKTGTEINEIVPRSRSKDAIMDWENRVLMCKDCHRTYHLHGVTNEKMQTLKEHRKAYLISIGREAYAKYAKT